MDLNDPRRRLQVLTQSSPSIRLATSQQPTPQIKVASSVKTPTIQIAGAPDTPATPTPRAAIPVPSSNQSIAGAVPEAPKSSGIGGFFKSAANMVSSPFRPLGAGIARILPGGQNDLKANEQAVSQLDQNQQVYNNLLKQGKINKDQYSKLTNANSANYSDVSKESQRIADTADRSQVVGSALQVPLAIFAPGGGFVRNVAGGSAFGLANEISSEKDPTLGGAAVQAGAGAVTGGLLTGFGALGGKIVNRISGKAGNIVEKIANETSASKLVRKFGIPEEAAGYLSKESNPETVKLVLDELSQNGVPIKGWVESPALANPSNAAPGPDAQINGFLDPSNPPQSYLPNGMHPPGAPDPVEVLTKEVADSKTEQEFRQAYNKLTGEDKAIADSALNGKTPEEFYAAVKSKPTPPVVAPDANTAPIIPAEGRRGVADTPLPQSESTAPADVSNNGITDAQKTIDQVGVDATPSGKSVGTDLPPEDIAAIKAAGGTPPEAPVAQSGTSEAAPQGDIPSQADQTTANGTSTPQSAENGSQSNLPQKASDIVPNADPETQKAVQEVLDNLNSGKPDYLSTGYGEKANAAKRAVLSVNGELEQYGAGGQAISQANKKVVEIAERGQAAVTERIPTVLKLKKDEFTNFVDALEALDKGKPISVTDKVAQALNEWRAVVPEIRNDATKVGLDVGDLGENYFPHSYTELMKTKDGTNMLINELVKSGQAKDTVEARQILEHLGNDMTQQFGSLEKSRLTHLPGYDKTKNALINYIEGAYKRIGQASEFGVKGEKASQMIDSAVREGFDGKRVDELYKVANGLDRGNTGTVEKASQVLQSFNRLKTLGLSAISNATQTVNDITKGGVLRSLKAYAAELSPEERAFVRETGIVSESAMKGLREGSGIGNKLTGKLTAPGFNTVETFNRTHSALTGKYLGDDLAVKAAAGVTKAEESLRKLGVTGDIGETLTHEQQIQAARGFTAATQFKVDPQDLPRWADTSVGRMIAQFRTFSYKQTKFMYDEVLREAAHGNVLPLIRFTAIGGAIGYGAGEVRNKAAGATTNKFGNQDQPNNSHVTDFVNALQNVGATGVFNDAAFLAQNVKSTRFPQYVAGTLGGPTASTAVETTINTQKAATGNATPIERQGLKAIPVVGRFLSNKFTPYQFSTKGTKANVMDDSGQEMIDSNGKKITVNIPKDATTLEKQAYLNDAKDKAYKAHAVGLLSKTDAEIYKVGEKDKSLLSSDQLQKYNQLKQWVGSYGKPTTTPDGVESDLAKQVYQKYNSMDAKDQKYWLSDKNPPDESSKQITEQVNSQRMDGLSEFKPSNALAKLYADYEKKLNTNADLTEVDKRNEAKKFQTAAAKLNLDANQNDIYAEGGSSDLKTLIENKQIDKADLDAAMKLDEELYNTGLTGSLKFSKKFRETYGYNVPTGGKGPNANANGSSKSENAHLDALIPSGSGGNSGGSGAPTFSARARSLPSFKNVNLPQGKPAPKVTIKL